MRTRIPILLTSLALVAVACGEGPAPAGEGEVLRYAYQPGQELIYNTDLAMSMDITTDGDLGMPGGFDMTVEMEIAASSSYEIDEGPDPATVRLTTGFEIVDGWATAEMLGMTEEIPLDQVTSQLGAFEMEMIIDAQGNVVEMLVGGEAIPPGLLDALGGGAAGSPLGGFGGPQLLGPELPAGPVAVGTTWTTEVTQDTFGIVVRSVGEHRVTGIETVAGRETYRIETTTTTDAIEFSLADLMRAAGEEADLLNELAGGEMSAAEFEASMAMLEAMGMEMDYRLDRSVAETVTWFDAVAGVMVRMESTMPQRASISMRGIPEAGDISMDMDMEMTSIMQLTG